jgi:hypothetical protein
MSLSLREVKAEIARAEAKLREQELLKATLEGQRKSALETLLTVHGCASPEAAVELIATKTTEVEELQQDQIALEAELTALEQKHA